MAGKLAGLRVTYEAVWLRGHGHEQTGSVESREKEKERGRSREGSIRVARKKWPKEELIQEPKYKLFVTALKLL